LRARVFTLLLVYTASIAAAAGPEAIHYAPTTPSPTCMAVEQDTVWASFPPGGVPHGLIALNAADGSVRQYDSAHGDLPTDLIASIAIDELGNKWLATARGVLQFRGAILATFDSTNCPIPSDGATALAVDTGGHLWVATSIGLLEFDQSKWTRYDTLLCGCTSCEPYDTLVGTVGGQYALRVRPCSVQSVAVDHAGNTWLLTCAALLGSQQLIKFDGTRVLLRVTSAASSVQRFAIDQDDHVWLVGSGTTDVYRFDGTSWAVYGDSTRGLPSFTYVTSVASDGRGSVFFGTLPGLARFDGTGWSLACAPASARLPQHYSTLAVGPQGEIWVGAPGSIAKVTSGTWRTFRLADACQLPYAGIRACAVDRSGHAWIATYHPDPGRIGGWEAGGVTEFDGQSWETHTSCNSGLPSNFVACIAIDDNDTKWIGTDDGGLAAFDGVNWTVYTPSNSVMPDSAVRSITIDKKGRKVVGTIRGLAVLDGQTWTVYDRSNSGLPANSIAAVAVDSANGLWVGTFGGGLAHFDGILWSVYNTTNSDIPGNMLTAVAVDSLNNVWVGARLGAGPARFDGQHWQTYRLSRYPGLLDSNVTSIVVENGSTVWVATSVGLAKIDRQDVTTVFFAGVTALTVDAHGNKWFGYNAQDTMGGLWIYREGGVALHDAPRSASAGGVACPLLSVAAGQPGSLSIRYTVRATGRVRLCVHGLMGSLVETIVDRVQVPGTYTVTWSARRHAASPASAGLLIVRLESGSRHISRSAVWLTR
jgi:ligand-binding sensor domain-containing protein